MVAQREPTRFTEREYLALEGVAETKHEYLGGLILAMAGADFAHNRITLNTAIELSRAAGDGPCAVVTSDQRVKLVATRDYFYPDVVVVCGPPTLVEPAPRSLTNPTIVVEVLSASTARYDGTEKLEAYRRIPSLADYLLVASERRHVTHYYRQGMTLDAEWGVRTYTSGAIALAQGLSIDFERIYHRVEGLGQTEAP